MPFAFVNVVPPPVQQVQHGFTAYQMVPPPGGSVIDDRRAPFFPSAFHGGPSMPSGPLVPSQPPLTFAVSELSARSGPAPGGSVSAAALPLLPDNLEPESMFGRVWSLSRKREGCRAVQNALEVAVTDEVRVQLASELAGRVWEAARHPHANHVLQKCVCVLPVASVQFVIDELLQRNVLRMACHKYGCRVIQRTLEHCRPDQVHDMVEMLLTDTLALSQHTYANYVMQHVCEFGSSEQQNRLAREFEPHVRAIGSDVFACAVLGAALQHGSGDAQMALARALTRERGLLASMARTRRGHVAVKATLTLLEGVERENAYMQLVADNATLRTRYGRCVAACMSAGVSTNTSVSTSLGTNTSVSASLSASTDASASCSSDEERAQVHVPVGEMRTALFGNSSMATEHHNVFNKLELAQPTTRM